MQLSLLFPHSLVNLTGEVAQWRYNCAYFSPILVSAHSIDLSVWYTIFNASSGTAQSSATLKVRESMKKLSFTKIFLAIAIILFHRLFTRLKHEIIISRYAQDSANPRLIAAMPWLFSAQYHDRTETAHYYLF